MDLKSKKSEEIEQFFESLQKLREIIKQALEERSTTFNGERYLKGEEVHELLHISDRTLQNYRDKGILGYVQIFGKMLYKESEVKKLLEDNYYSPFNTDY